MAPGKHRRHEEEERKQMRNINKTMLRYITIALTALATVTPPSIEAKTVEMSNRVVFIVDASGSYRARQSEAIERAVAVLDKLAAQQIRRWEPASDRITVISLDALPDVLWEGTIRDLKTMDRRAWVNRFRARSDYASCTDVGAAFRLAVRHLQGDAQTIDKYIFAFTDLVDEPPTTSLKVCRRASSLPDNGFPWEQLHEVSVSVFWVPPDQTLSWRRAVAEHGIEPTFAIHAASESGEITIVAPPRPTVVVTEADRAASRGRIVEMVSSVGRSVGFVLAALVLIVVAVLLASFVTRRLRGPRPPTAVAMRVPNRTAHPVRPPLAVARPGVIRHQSRRPTPPRPNGL
jgi:hypothetical protein